MGSSCSRGSTAAPEAGMQRKGKSKATKVYPMKGTKRPSVERHEVTVRQLELHGKAWFTLVVERDPEGLSLLAPSCWHYNIVGDVGGDHVTRSYTPIASTDSTLTFAIKLYHNGTMSQYLRRLTAGDPLTIFGPVPGAYLHTPGTIPKLNLISAGSGITAFTALFARGEAEKGLDVCLLDANTSEDEVMCLDQIKHAHEAYLNRGGSFLVRHLLSDPKTTDPPQGHPMYGQNISKGRLTATSIHEHMFPPGDDTLVLICGPDGFMDMAHACCQGLGFDAADIVMFPNAPSSSPMASDASVARRSAIENALASLPSMTIEQVRSESLWMVVDSLVIDVAEFVTAHPGGSVILDGCAVDDASDMFHDTYHGTNASTKLLELAIGKIPNQKSLNSYMRGSLSAMPPMSPKKVLSRNQSSTADILSPDNMELTSVAGLLGKDLVNEISFEFHERIWARDTHLAELFKTRASRKHITFMLTLFLMQHLGKDPMWGGFEQPLEAIRGVHTQFGISTEDRDEWLEIMQSVLDDKIPADLGGQPRLVTRAKEVCMDWFTRLADEFVNRV